jgi:hypothetical protein
MKAQKVPMLSKKSSAGGITILNFIVTKIVWYFHEKNRYLRQWHRAVDSEINPHSYYHLILDKGDKNIYWRKDSLFYEWCSENWVSI